MSEQSIGIDPVSPVIGAEVSGVDLSEPITPEAFAALHAALMTHQVLFFRDQELSFEQHKAFGRLFGDLHIHPAAPKDGAHPEILVVHGDANPPHGSTEVRVKKRAHVLDDFVPASATAGADWRRGVEPAVHPERSPTLAPNPLRSVVGAPIVALPCERSTPHSTRGSRRGERDGEAPRRRRRRAAIDSGRPHASTATGERKRAIAVLVGTTPHRRTGRQRRSPPSSSARR